ncbi:MAG: hypothetical protein Q8K55_06940 [Gemmatimonadaceae bacterium]|nr:hypothetical protein [Gemmatimonadaceae bacterium]
MIVLGAALALSVGPLQAQVIVETHPDDEPVPTLNKKPSGFQMFGLGDFALTGMRSGGNSYWKTTSNGPSDDNTLYSAGLPGRIISRGIGGWFELQLWMAASRGDWSRFRDVVPSLENVKGGGWNHRTQLSRWTSDRRELAFTGRDGSVGSLFSGVTSESGTGSCRDNNTSVNSFIAAGLPLLAGSDCPDTWTGSTFDGERPVPDSVYLNTFKANPSGFTWDDWKIPASRRAQDKLYGAFQTFGSAVDFGREARSYFGSVIPGGSGAPIKEGYPMGIEWRFEAWTYAVPTVADAMFWKANIINRSADVYGVGLDYDSLFLGFMGRPFPSGTQSPTFYVDLKRQAYIGSMINQNGTNCYGANHGANVTGGYSAGGLLTARLCLSNTSGARGNNGTFQAVVVLKSPIGDLRNKKFTDPASPFYNPTHPNRGDTLNINQASACGFTCVTSNGVGVSARATYGVVTNNEADIFAAVRPPSEWSAQGYFDMFHNYDFPARWSPQTGRVGGFARYVPPGNWDYNHDGKLDTLKVFHCTDPVASQSLDGCVVPFSDTTLGGFPATVHNNYWAGAGPVKLKAGDTTSYWLAYLSTTDSTALEKLIDNVTGLYQNFWLSPEPPCPVNVVSAVPTGGNRQFDTFLRLYFDQQHNECQDKFLIEQAKILKASTTSGDVRLKVYNPRIVNNMRKIALPRGTILRDTVAVDTLPATQTACSSAATFNAAMCRIVTDTALGVIDSLLVFKSCTGGATYTSSTGTNCYPTVSRDAAGGATRYPWQRYARLARAANGNWPSVYSDGSITGGLTYTYVFVGQSFPAVWDIVELNAQGQFVNGKYSIRPATFNGLSANTANRNVAAVYIPVSRQAGATASSITLAPLANDTIASYSITTRVEKTVSGKDPVVGRMVLSDSAEVEAFYQVATAAVPTKTTVRLFQLGDSGTVGATRRFAVRKEEYTVNGSVDVAGKPTVTTVVSGASKTVFSRFRTPATRRLQLTFIQGAVPMYVSDTISSADDNTPAATLANPNYVGMFFALDTTRQRALRGTFWQAEGIPVQLSGTAPTIGWVPGTQRDTIAYNRYQITFSGKEFGPGYPFTFDRNNQAKLPADYAASLAARVNAGTTSNTAAAAAALNLALNRSNITVDSLASLGIPFTVKNMHLNANVTMAVLKSSRTPTALLGTNADTMRVTVPSDQWVPGDQLYFIETFKVVRHDTVTTSPLVRRIRLVNGVPDSVAVSRVTWGPTRIACGTPVTCNPLTGIGGTGYTATNANQTLNVLYYRPIRGMPAFTYSIAPDVAGENIAAVKEGDLSLVKVVPNPYIMFSHYEQTAGLSRLMFTHLPPTGTLRIYTASGQLVQQIKWNPSDLQRNCRATVNTTQCSDAGDLQWNMRTREDLEIGPGFYVFVVSTEVGGKKVDKLGKFVIIR